MGDLGLSVWPHLNPAVGGLLLVATALRARGARTLAPAAPVLGAAAPDSVQKRKGPGLPT